MSMSQLSCDLKLSCLAFSTAGTRVNLDEDVKESTASITEA